MKQVCQQMLAFLLLCVGGLSYAESKDDAEYYNLFQNIQCQYYADWAGYSDARNALWERNNKQMYKAEDVNLSSFDVAFIVNQQYDHAAATLINTMVDKKMVEKDAAKYLYSLYCNNI